MLKTLTNEEIYFINNQFNIVFEESNQYLPAKLNFYIQKNKKKIMDLAMEIEQARINIIQNFGESTEEGKYFIPKEHIEAAQNELNDLLNISQTIDICPISIDDIENLQFTLPQMEVLMFMIKE